MRKETEYFQKHIHDLRQKVYDDSIIDLVKDYYQTYNGKFLTLSNRGIHGSYKDFLINKPISNGTYSSKRLFYFSEKHSYIANMFFFQQLPTNCGIAFFYGLSLYSTGAALYLKFIYSISKRLGFSQILFTHALTPYGKQVAIDAGYELVHETRNRRSSNYIQTFVKDI